MNIGKTKTLGRIALLLAVVGLTSALTSEVWAARAPVYPGAVFDAVASSARKHASKVYLSHDSLQQVRAWYQPRLAKQSIAGCTFKKPQEGCGAFKQTCESPTGNEKSMQCTDEIVLKWNYIPPGSSMVDAFNAGVHLQGWESPPGQKQSPNDNMKAQADTTTKSTSGQSTETLHKLDAMAKQSQDMGNQMIKQMQQDYKKSTGVDLNASQLAAIPDMPFKGLKHEVISGRHSQQELDALYHQYRWLTTAFYPMKKTAKGVEAYNRWLVARTQARIHKPQQAVSKAAGQFGEGAAQVGARMQQLIQQGRMDEARKLAEQMSNATQGSEQIGKAEASVQSRDHWQQWVAALKQLAAHAYKTKIIIDTF